MSIWKSPVFYFGVLLFCIVTAAMAAPYVVPWNNYRADLEDYGRKLTGREVTIGGDIAVKLFPWPQLEARKVTVGNPEGFSDAAFLTADAMRVRLSLGGLFNGSIDVQSVEVEGPSVNLQRNSTGSVNWIFVPKEQVAGQGLLSRVKLDQIVLSRGLLSFDDLRNGNSTALTGLDATLSAQSILGPWRMKGDATWNDAVFDINVVTSAKETDQPLKFTVKLLPHDLVYPQAALEGAWDGTAFKGAVRIDPQLSNGEKQSAEGTFKPLAMQALVEASEQRMSLLKIRIAPADRKDSGTLIEGDAVIDFGTQSVARLDLKSPRINLDTLMGAGALQQWRDGGFLSVANQLMLNTPMKLTADYKLNVSVLTSGGQALNDVRISGSLQKEALRVKEFVAELPGRSVGVFDGVLFPGQGAAQLGGKFKFESADTRAFLGWLAPQWREQFAQHWTGSRGRLEVLSGALDWTRDSVAVRSVNFRFDGNAGKASLAASKGAAPLTRVTVEMDQLDLDGLVPNGWSMIRDGGFASGISSAAIAGTDASALQVQLAVKRLMLNGVVAQDTAFDVVRQKTGFDIKKLEIGNVGGAQLQGGGALVDKGEGPEGAVTFNLKAEDPRGFLRLTGLEYGRGNWTSALGQTQFTVQISAVAQKSGPEIEILARGTSGALNVNLKATAREIEKGPGMNLTAAGGLNSADGAVLARLVGVQPVNPLGAGDLGFEFNGSIAEGFAVTSRLKALDAVAEFAGTAKPTQAFYGVSGKATVVAADGRAVVNAVGLPLTAGSGQPFQVSTVVAVNEGVLALLDVAGNVAGQRFSGNASVLADKRIEADFETDSIGMTEVLSLAFMPWTGPVNDLGNNFADVREPLFRGEVFLRPLQFETQTATSQKEVVVGIGFDVDERRLSIVGPGENGLKADVVVKPKGDSTMIEGSAVWPVDLPQHFKTREGADLVNGSLLLKGEFKASGRSPAAAFAELKGKGNFWLEDAAFPHMTLDSFQTAVLGATTPAALTVALAQLENGPGTEIGQRIGNFEIANGTMSLSPFGMAVKGVDASISPQVDLTSQHIKLTTVVRLAQQADSPPVTITYEGASAEMGVRQGTSALAAKLGYALLSKEMAELERLQQEQQALAAKEEAQRLEDEQRFADYQNTRAELRMQARVRRFHIVQRERQAKAMQAIVDAAVKASAVTARIDLQRHARRLAVRRAVLN